MLLGWPGERAHIQHKAVDINYQVPRKERDHLVHLENYTQVNTSKGVFFFTARDNKQGLRTSEETWSQPGQH